MSKEKLQEIKDKYAKVNYDNGESHATSWQELIYDNSHGKGLIRIIEQNEKLINLLNQDK